jgi:hypothetical protein
MAFGSKQEQIEGLTARVSELEVELAQRDHVATMGRLALAVETELASPEMACMIDEDAEAGAVAAVVSTEKNTANS